MQQTAMSISSPPLTCIYSEYRFKSSRKIYGYKYISLSHLNGEKFFLKKVFTYSGIIQH